LLERRGSSPVLFVTKGFGDLLEIENQQRVDLFALHVVKPLPLYGAVVEVDERLRADGEIERSLDVAAVETRAGELVREGFRQAAVALMHGYRNPAHERALATILQRSGFEHVSISSELASRIKIVPRARTAVVNAYLAESVGGYLRTLAEELGTDSFYVMNSAGGLARASEFCPKDSLLSGPAGGVVGAVTSGARSGQERVLSFDMGGTSTDVARSDGRLEYSRETVVGDARLSSPAVSVETVAAGGGSICRFDGQQLKVGPDSAGADPGPACYGRGGPLTLTDVNLLLGRLSERHFSFGVNRGAAEEEADRVWIAHRETTGSETAREELLFGFLRIANESMAGAVRAISLAAGYRPSEYALVTFGGAGPQHACALADLLDIGVVLVPEDASLLSALGLGHARLERFVELQVLTTLEESRDRLQAWFGELYGHASSWLVQNGVEGAEIEVARREAFLRFRGQESTMVVEWMPEADLGTAFLASYEHHFGYLPRAREIEVESLRLMAAGPSSVGTRDVLKPDPTGLDVDRESGEGICKVYCAGDWQEGRILSRVGLSKAGSVSGPAWIVENHTLTVVEPRWHARLDSAGSLVLEKR
jgi:5-oxoprolinase (ATP-hydrolysing)